MLNSSNSPQIVATRTVTPFKHERIKNDALALEGVYPNSSLQIVMSKRNGLEGATRDLHETGEAELEGFSNC